MAGSIFRRFLGGRWRRGGARGEEPLESVVGAQFVQHEVDQLGADEGQCGEMRPRVLDLGTFQQNDGAAVGFREPNIADDTAFLEVPDGRGFGAEQVPEIAMHGAGQFPFDGEDAHDDNLRCGWRCGWSGGRWRASSGLLGLELRELQGVLFKELLL